MDSHICAIQPAMTAAENSIIQTIPRFAEQSKIVKNNCGAMFPKLQMLKNAHHLEYGPISDFPEELQLTLRHSPLRFDGIEEEDINLALAF